ncbi:hypothetical protein C1H70_09400 [Halomonas urumqiensis]|uniref:Uncharacterized protein n=2 Tax=Halomonas urumqiensis TaxID=1684789 RepID=A0A2N7UIB8_9GAMM|nr:hypothetical protein C1H70_09400 [Halomonas urumqiensis]
MKLSSESRNSGVAKATSLLVSSKLAIYRLAKWVAILSIVAMFLSLMTGVFGSLRLSQSTVGLLQYAFMA